MKKTLLLVALSFAVLASACNKPQTEDKYAAEMEKVAKNNELATRFFTSAWNNGDFAVVDELIPADALDHALIPGKSPEQGPASFKSIIGMFRAAMPDIKLTIHDDFGSGDKIVHRWSLTGHHTGAALMGVLSLMRPALDPLTKAPVRPCFVITAIPSPGLKVPPLICSMVPFDAVTVPAGFPFAFGVSNDSIVPAVPFRK